MIAACELLSRERTQAVNPGNHERMVEHLLDAAYDLEGGALGASE
jgi:hypothetical protein